MTALADSVRAGRRRALGRALTWVESRDERGDALLALLADGSGTFRLGITGAPGVGKSSLVAELIGRLRRAGERVAVVAVDPTSPISGGALLGDRLRMRGHQDDDGVFIRSLASRSGVGGLAGATDEVAELLARAGFGIVLIETVGVGQLEMGIAGEADAVFLLISPEGGDVIQFLKGGLMEVVDRIVVNKSDRPGADETLRVVRQLAHERDEAEPLAVSCHEGRGLDDLVEVILEAARQHRADARPERAVTRVERRVRRRLEDRWLERAWARVGGRDIAREAAERIARGEARFVEEVEALARQGEIDASESANERSKKSNSGE
ncbi:MAG: methylmalonyl Co-A mutase-associated GTPase MeaB [Planctomycetes bacterium]|nr:methylmalonyl Co-A mutase-associated GTPase MeaB [Planctomycetota bacterium]